MGEELQGWVPGGGKGITIEGSSYDTGGRRGGGR